MPIKIFTLPFHDETQTFHDDVVTQFCLNKRVHKLDTKFFMRNQRPFWTIAVYYDLLGLSELASAGVGEQPEKYLDEHQKVLLLRLKEWRKQTAGTNGLPVYMIATNTQLVSIIQQKCVTLESLKLINGFGNAKMEKYGKHLIDIIKQFYNTE